MVKAPWHDGLGARPPEEPEIPRITEITRWSVKPGDKLIVHVSGLAGVGPGYAGEIASQVRAAFGLDESTGIVVVTPGMRVEVMEAT